ncbi:hypothetical protein ACTNDP_15040 [Paenibacillus barengoltzii]|uniref:hypothetical protein n=1 Tax=Paenibacillus barengoltzii TaxID=343517 RepID=UPI003F8C8EFF
MKPSARDKKDGTTAAELLGFPNPAPGPPYRRRPHALNYTYESACGCGSILFDNLMNFLKQPAVPAVRR